MTTYQAAYSKFLPLVLQLPEDTIHAFQGDAGLALVNVRLGVQAVLGTTDQIDYVRLHLPQISLDDVLDLPDLARALVYASEKTNIDVTTRDRLWTMLLQRHEYLRKIGFYVYGDDAEQHTPRLLSDVSANAFEERDEEESDEIMPAIH